jgi:hypothetical protein
MILRGKPAPAFRDHALRGAYTIVLPGLQAPAVSAI